MLNVKGSHRFKFKFNLGRASNLPRKLGEDRQVVAKTTGVKGVQEARYKRARSGEFYKGGKQDK